MPKSKPLKEYAKKRDFEKTPEPKGSRRRKNSDELNYVVQNTRPCIFITTFGWRKKES
ncbi:MAG: hypothetical protein AB1715_10925 [Acidobacteriota bacterium]